MIGKAFFAVLAWLFPLRFLIPKARLLGVVSFQEVAGVGWQCAIRPPIAQVRKRGAINCWTGQGLTMAVALRDALTTAADNPKILFEGDPRHAPRLGGREFDN